MPVVLLVEDNPRDAALVGSWLEQASPSKFVVRHVTLGEAERRASSREFEAAILDLELANGGGLDTVRRFRASAPVCPIVVLTADVDERIATWVVQCGADEVVRKATAGPRVLSTAIERAITRQRSAEAMRARLRDVVCRYGLDVHPDGLVIHDDAGHVSFANGSAGRMLGIAEGDVLAEPLRRTAQRWSGVATVTSPDGDESTLEVFGRSIADGDGPVTGRLLLVRGVESGNDSQAPPSRERR